MKVNRRQVLKTTALGTLAGLLPISSFANSIIDTKSIVVLTTGLETDAAFAEGARAEFAVPFQLTMSNYERLVEVLSDAQGRDIFALIEPASELLIGQAARDAEVKILMQKIVAPSASEDIKRWAHNIGEAMLTEESIDHAHPQSKNKLIALKISA